MNNSRYTPKSEIPESHLFTKKHVEKRSYQAKTTKRVTPSTDKQHKPPLKP